MTYLANQLAPQLAVSEWMNTRSPITLEGLRGRVVYLHAFQALCPGCVAHAIPQVLRIERIFSASGLAVIGLHTVFEHHAAMSPVTLKAFLHEYKVTSPVGVDLAGEHSDVPVTMGRYRFRGTPSSVLIGRDGIVLHEAFGVEDDLIVGARIAMALSTASTSSADDDVVSDCADGRCSSSGAEDV